MKRFFYKIALYCLGSIWFLLLFSESFANPPSGTDLIIWYNKPADKEKPQVLKSWEGENPDVSDKNNPDHAWHLYSLPIGNGFMGASLYGGVALDRIQMNEKTLWTGGPGVKGYHDADQPDSYKKLASIRQLVYEGKIKDAEALSRNVLRGNWSDEEYTNFFGAYQTLGELDISTGIDETRTTNYRRQLDLSTAIASVTFDSGNTSYKREVFCSYPDRCLVVHYTANKTKSQNLRVSFVSPHPLKGHKVDNQLVLNGQLPSNQLEIETRIAVNTKKGETRITNDAIEIKDADEVTLIITAGTNYRMSYPDFFGESPSKRLETVIKNAEQKSFDQLKKAHIEDYCSLFNRVSINLGTATSEQKQLPSDERMKQNATVQDPGLEAQYFQFGRYLLISSSRPGSLPANLQGVWCNEVVPPWFSDYHLNINLQMNYWLAGPCNLIECQEPLIDYIDFLRKPGEKTARAYNNAGGWTAHIHSNIWGFTSPNVKVNAPLFWTWFPIGGPWLAQHAWEQYAFTGDEKLLKEKLYPILKSSARFLEDYLTKLPDGKYTSCPSWSPEHGPVSKGTTMDIAVSRETLTEAIEAARILKVDADKIKTWKSIIANLVPYQIGKWGQLQEWYEDIDDPKDQHRHINHLFGLFPGTQISMKSTPALARAAQISLEHRGDEATGWSMGWKLNFWTRLQNGDHAYKLFRNLLTKRTHPNFWNSHPPFQIDGNFGGTVGIAEMLLQSQDGAIHLLPALPSAWNTGNVKGLLARGNVSVDMEWANGKLENARLLANKSGKYIVRYRNTEKELELMAGKPLVLNAGLEPVN